MIKRKLSAIAIVLIICLAASGCASDFEMLKKPQATHAYKPDINARFALILPNDRNEKYISMQKGFSYAASETGNAVDILYYNDDPARQSELVRDCAAGGYDAVALVPSDSGSAQAAVEALRNANVHPFVMEEDLLLPYYSKSFCATMNFDPLKIAQMITDWMADNTKGDFVIVTGDGRKQYPINLNMNIEELSDSVGKNTLVDVIETGNDPSQAKAKLLTALGSQTKFDTVVCADDDIAQYVVEALQEKGMLNDPVKVVSIGCSPKGIQMLKEGSLSMGITASPAWEAYACYRLMMGQCVGMFNYSSQNLMLNVNMIDKKTAETMDPETVASWEPSDDFRYFSNIFLPRTMWYGAEDLVK